MTDRCHERVKKIWQVLAPAAKSLKKSAPGTPLRFFRGPNMNPLTYWEQIIKMPNKADKLDLRLRIIKSVTAIDVKPTAQLFDTTPRTVRKWLARYRQERFAGLNELPMIPHHCPHKTSSSLEMKVVTLRKQFPFKGNRRLKREHDLSCSHEAIRRILNEHGLTRKHVKKAQKQKETSERLKDAGSCLAR